MVSDASALALEDIVDAAFAGRPAELETQLAKARTAGSTAGSILFNAQRQLAQLHKWRTTIEAGGPFSLDAVQPPLHFRRKALVEAALKSLERGAARHRHGRAGRSRAGIAAQHRRSPTPLPSARCLAIATHGRRERA